MATLLPYPKFKAVDSSGVPYSGGKVYTYMAGTSTAKVTYSDRACSTANSNPVVLDSSGEATIYLKGTYKIILKTSADVEIWTLDNVSGMGDWQEGGYYADYNETDQGATGSGASIKALVDTISTDSGSIILAHNSGSATTTYTLNTSETIPSNIELIIQKGAIISIGSGVTLTIQGPFNAGLYQVFSGAGSVVFGAGSAKEVFPEWWGTGDSIIQSAIDAVTTSLDPIVLQSDSYTSSGLTFTKAIWMKGKGKLNSIITYTGTDKAIYINCSGSSIRGMHLSGFEIDANTYIGIQITCSASDVLHKSLFEDLYLYDVSKGIYQSDTNTTFYKCKFRDIWISTVSEYGIYTYGTYNKFENIEISYIGDNAYAIYNSSLNSSFSDISADGCIADASQNTVWIEPIVETIYATTPPNTTVFNVAGYNIILIKPVLTNIANAKCTYGFSFSNTYHTVINPRIWGANYPDYAFAPSSGSAGTIIDPQVLQTHDMNVAVSADIMQNWEIIGGNTITQIKEWKYNRNIQDDGTVDLPVVTNGGWGTVQIGDNQEFTQFRFTSAGVVTLYNNSTNVANTDSDGNLCVYDGGTHVIVKNRLASTLNIHIQVFCS